MKHTARSTAVLGALAALCLAAPAANAARPADAPEHPAHPAHPEHPAHPVQANDQATPDAATPDASPVTDTPANPCDQPAFRQVFAPWHDRKGYVLTENGGLEQGDAGWTLADGAAGPRATTPSS